MLELNKIEKISNKVKLSLIEKISNKLKYNLYTIYTQFKDNLSIK